MGKGNIDTDKNWNMACFIMNRTEVNIDENGEKRSVNLEMSYNDISTIKDNMERLKNTISDLSGNQMTITYDIIQISEPLTSLTYDKENEYYASPNDVNNLIEDYVDKEEYDYIYVVVRLGDLNKSDDVLVHNWIGLRLNEI